MESPAAHRDSEGFSELAPLLLQWGHPGLPLRQGAGLPQATPNNPRAEGPGSALSLLLHPWLQIAAISASESSGCCLGTVVATCLLPFYLTLQNFAFSRPVWRTEPGTEICQPGLATDLLAQVPPARLQRWHRWQGWQSTGLSL